MYNVSANGATVSPLGAHKYQLFHLRASQVRCGELRPMKSKFYISIRDLSLYDLSKENKLDLKI